MSRISEALKSIAERRADLGVKQMSDIFDEIMSGSVADEVLAAFLTALKMKGETVDEIVGAAVSMRSKALFVNTGSRVPVDIVGTGGDGLNTLNISTTSAFIIAGAGVCVAEPPRAKAVLPTFWRRWGSISTCRKRRLNTVCRKTE